LLEYNHQEGILGPNECNHKTRKTEKGSESIASELHGDREESGRMKNILDK